MLIPSACADYTKSLAPADFLGAVFTYAKIQNSTEIFALCQFFEKYI